MVAGVEEGIEQIPARPPVSDEVYVVLRVQSDQRPYCNASHIRLRVLERVDHFGQRREVLDLSKRAKSFGANVVIFVFAGGNRQRFYGKLISNAALAKFARGVLPRACDGTLE